MIVRERLTEFGLPNSVIRRLFDVGAGIRMENEGNGGRIPCLGEGLLDIVLLFGVCGAFSGLFDYFSADQQGQCYEQDMGDGDFYGDAEGDD